MEQGEYERFIYHRPGSNILMGFINHPNQRMADGIFLGLQHSTKNPAIDRSPTSRSTIDYYKNVDWPWVTHAADRGRLVHRDDQRAGQRAVRHVRGRRSC